LLFHGTGPRAEVVASSAFRNQPRLFEGFRLRLLKKWGDASVVALLTIRNFSVIMANV